MSCKHGNWEPCDQCDEEDSAWNRAFNAGKAEAYKTITSALAAEIECEVFETHVQPALGRIQSNGAQQ